MNLAAFRENLLKPSVKLRYKFLYDGDDFTSMLTKSGLATIRRDINLSAGIAMVTLNNAGGWWNFLHESNDALSDPAQIQVYIDGDASNVYTVFKGVAKHPVFEGATVTLQIKDHNSSFLDRLVGSNDSPATFYQGTLFTNADERIFRLLTVDGGLDATASPLNNDIKYASFARWRDNHIRPNSYAMTGKPTGQSVGELVMILCQMSHSFIWINNDGLVEFAPPFEPGFEYIPNNTGRERRPGEGRDLEIRDDLLINNVTVRHGYNFEKGSWAGNVNDTDAASIAKFGTFPKTIEGRIFAHHTSASATSDRDATLVNYAFPLRFFNIIAGFPAILEDLCRELTVSDTVKSITNADPIAESIIWDLNTWEVMIKARWPW